MISAPGLDMKIKSAAASIPSPSANQYNVEPTQGLGSVKSTLVRSLMISYILSMCIALPVSLFPIYLLHKAGIINRVQKEKVSLQVGQFCSRWMMRLFPFAKKRVIVDKDDENYKNPQPSIWVCNHISLLDIFFVLALDKQMRGEHRRPIKILYWKGLESNLVTRALFKMCGFIPVNRLHSSLFCSVLFLLSQTQAVSTGRHGGQWEWSGQ